MKKIDRQLPLYAGILALLMILLVFLPVMRIGIQTVSSQAEAHQTSIEVERIEQFLHKDLTTLDNTLHDWASKDDTYRFIQDGDPVFIDSHLNDRAIANVDVDVIIALAIDGRVVTARAVGQSDDGAPAIRRPLPFDPQDLLLSYPTILTNGSQQGEIKGLAVLVGQTWLVAARPVRTSLDQGPYQGMLIFIRSLDDSLMAEYSRLTASQVHLSLSYLHPADVPAPSSQGEKIFVKPRDAHMIDGYQYLNDLNGQPTMLLWVESQRDLYAQAQAAARVFSAALLVLALLLFGGVYAFTDAYQRSRRASQQYLERFRAVVEQSGEAILLVIADAWGWRILDANPACMRLLGWAPAAAQPGWLNQLVTFEPALDACFIDASATNGQVSEHHGLRHDNVALDIELSTSLISDSPSPTYSLILHDVTARKSIEKQLRYDALHDELTGLPNRSFLIDSLNRINERKKREPDLLFGLFFLDFDRFKQINDSMGHQAGDLLLTQAAQRMQSSLRATDVITRSRAIETVARIAGDEFIILLENFHAVEDIFKAGERIVEQINQPFTIYGFQVSLTASLGIVIPEVAYDNIEDIIRDADIAMIRAKRAGGGQTVRFDPLMYQSVIERMQIECDMRLAIERGEFEVYYQPIFTLDADKLVGFEALVRWNHPTRGLLMPSEFIPVAEETGLIVPVGFFVMEEACHAIQTWNERYPAFAGLTVSVNVAVRQFNSNLLFDRTRTILATTHIDPSRLWLEVTESTLLQNDESVLNQLRALRALGIRIEIDDFGIGYSSLSYLKDFPLDGFKIDRSFIKDIHEDGQQIIKALIQLGHVLGLSQVAEGVETECQKDYLKSLSCDYMQGFLMSKPITASAVEALIEQI